ncbi:MAG TPA: transcriptional regulator NrdR [Bdellovibrionales bacterium]|nr:transcriptional regulator NrdR [Pseudobdellovibrionaceae bacterium]HAG91192.1 transcriptional regulator NrdR [Bdellovibrionales bacterium]|tara:strand:- start:6097 stop:6552 length:456 start_codon:yes stop_codon:yes gene_type:complete
MKCPHCGQNKQKVLETREREDEIRRRRECLSCQFRFTTSEAVLIQYPHVIKKDGRREPFSKEKLRRGILAACKKRPVSVGQIENLVMHIARWAQSSPEKELLAQSIGQIVISELKKLDDVAFVRFASVYKSFSSVPEFFDNLMKEETDGPA